jgi:lipopolysaccharide/colanic/teichoic acid biosynthesis glycosyltransferase
MLLVRYFAWPSRQIFMLHLVPFTMFFVVWLLIFFMMGLYDQHTTFYRARLPERILRVQIGNIILAALFFFFVPVFQIAPKTNLILYLIISFVILVWWRLWIFPRIFRGYRSEALLIADDKEMEEHANEINNNSRYPFYFSNMISIDSLSDGALGDRIFAALRNEKLRFVVIDIKHRKLVNILPHLYKPLFSNVQFIDARELYEEIFERVPLSVLEDGESFEYLTGTQTGLAYETIKRFIDLLGGLIMGIFTIAVTPFIWFAMYLEGPGPLFITQERFGKHGARIRVFKFRTMTFNDAASASWVKEGEKVENKVTKVGAFLRLTSLDEFPQFINVIMGDISLVGPRNDIIGLGERLADAIPLYNMRYRVKPGITGWAQINQQYEQGNISPQSIEETKVRLAYDFYYIRHRSLLLDIVIALKTFKRMVFRVSSW